MILQRNEENADFVNLKVLVDGVIAEVVPASCVRTALHQLEAAWHQLLEARVVVLVLVYLDKIPFESSTLEIVLLDLYLCRVCVNLLNLALVLHQVREELLEI